MVISGVNADELEDIILVHKRVIHRKIFEETRLGKLPPEIMLKILGYVTPDCRKCFRQRDLLRLGTVCKKLNQLTKTADLFREIRLTDECCPLPTDEVLARMLEKSGAKTRKIVCNYTSRELLSVALESCGDSIEEIHAINKCNIALPEVVAKIDSYKWENPTILAWEIREKLINESK